ncbi:MAG TPA: 16S rRNA (cytosine(1402)-N(4))-methyltransferase RsmH [Chlamydiales bacterium]|nr:16S rRNA (cytosine(1402)-N(4))-methyltransferase RsmH [Chlamydiales bacterium]
MHIPVLLDEILKFLADKKFSTFFDGTVGMGGHAEAILKGHPEIKKYLACDQDKDALRQAEKRLSPWKDKVEFIHGNFSHIQDYLKEKKIPCVDGVLFDVGVSSYQLDTETRGFSFMKKGPLDMRMDQSLPLTAETVVNEFPEKKLGELFRDLGEERRWRLAAKAIAEARAKKRIETTWDLVEVLQRVLKRTRHLHPATLVFQALRIYVNDEIHALEKGLKSAIEKLCPEGMIGVISFHSMEDRIVKNQFRDLKARKKKAGELTLLTKKPVVPTMKEMRANPRSRSAKLRFAQKRGMDE